MKRLSLITGSLLLALPLVAGCGGSDEDDDIGTNAVVVEVSGNPSVINVTQASILSTKFSFSSSDLFDEGDDIQVVVALPPQLRFRAGTAEIQRPIDDNDVNPDQELVCPDGSSFLRFTFGRSDLFDADNPSGDADAELTLTVDSTVPAGTVSIAATASDDTVAFSCAGGMGAQAQAAIIIQ